MASPFPGLAVGTLGSPVGGSHMEDVASEIIRRDVLHISEYREGFSKLGYSTPSLKGYKLPKMATYNRSSGMYFRKDGYFNFKDISERYDLKGLACHTMKSFKESLVDLYISEPSISIEFKRCMIALKLWETTPGRKLTTKEDVFKDLLFRGPQALDDLKDRWELGIRASHNLPVMGRTFSYERVEHYNALPAIDNLINWVEDPEDYKYMAETVSLDSEIVSAFEEELESLLPDELDLPADSEIWSKTKNSVSYSSLEQKSIPFWKARTTPEGRQFSTNFRGYRCIVPVSAGNTRDTVVVPIDVYNTINWVDKVILRILDECEESLITSSSSSSRRRLEKASSLRGGSYYLRDIKKCGMTFPRELFHIVQKILIRKYPDKDFRRFNIFKNYSVYVDGKSVPCNRGYCLGMANNLVTLCQIVIYRLVRNNLPESIQTDYYCGNDDSILFAKGFGLTEEDLAIVEMNDDQVMQGLGIVKHDVKSFWSLYPIIFEQYGKESFRSKDSRLAMALAPCYLVDDIKIAKRLCNSLSPLIGEVNESCINLVRDLASHWGYDYYPEEINYDYLLGGWYSKYSKGCHTILRDLMETHEDLIPMMYLAYRKCKAFESSIIPHYDEEGVADNYSHLGAALGIRYIKSNTKLPDYLRRESLLLPKSEYERFYKKTFELSRRPDKPFRLAKARCQRIRNLEDIHKLEFAKIIQSKSDRPLAIPKDLVMSHTFLWSESDKVEIHPAYFSNMLSGYLEGLRRSGDILSPVIHNQSRSEAGLISEHKVSPNVLDVRRYLTDEGIVPSGSYQFSRNPEIPLSEYLSIYGSLPESIAPFGKEFEPIPQRVYEYSPRDEREAIFILELSDDQLLDILIEVYREEGHVEIEEPKPPPIEELFRSECPEHPHNLLGGWEESNLYFNMQFENCVLCRLYSRYQRARSMKDTSDSLEVRQAMSEEFLIVADALRSYVDSTCPEQREILENLLDPKDFFEDQDDLFGSEGGIFDTGDW